MVGVREGLKHKVWLKGTNQNREARAAAGEVAMSWAFGGELEYSEP